MHVPGLTAHNSLVKSVKISQLNSFQIQVHLNKLECRGKVYFSNSTQIVKLVY